MWETNWNYELYLDYNCCTEYWCDRVKCVKVVRKEWLDSDVIIFHTYDFEVEMYRNVHIFICVYRNFYIFFILNCWRSLL